MFHLQIANLIQIVFVFQCLFGSLLLVNQPRLRVLIWLLLGNALLMSFNLLEEMGLTQEVHLITPVFSLLWGPLVWLFVRALLGQAPAPLPWLHFLAPVGALPFTESVQMVLALGALSQMLYAYWLVRMLLKYQETLQEVRSDAAELSLHWLILVLAAFGALALLDGLRHGLQPHLSLAVLQPWYTVMLASHLALFSYLIIKAANHPEVYASLGYCQSNGRAPSPTKLDSHAEQLFAFIQQHIAQTRLYQRERLSLRQVAEATGLLERDISRAINTVGKVSFNDFINGYRIEEIKARLGQTGDQTILEIALEAGFSSKSSFNTTFKRMTGVTPSRYAARFTKTAAGKSS